MQIELIRNQLLNIKEFCCYSQIRSGMTSSMWLMLANVKQIMLCNISCDIIDSFH